MQKASELVPPLRAATYSTLIGLLAVTGMRIGEAIRLDRDHIDWTGELLVVHAGKLGKSREVPLHPTTLQALRCYASRRDQLCARPAQPSFFISARSARLVYISVGQTFRRLLSEARIVRQGTARPPRLHDLRHSFIVRTFLNRTALASTSRLSCHGCRPMSDMRNPRPLTGTWRQRLSCSPSPPNASNAPSRGGHEHARTSAPGLLHRPSSRPAQRQPAHRRCLSRRLSSAAGFRD
ncbi:MAG: tyrosine-type recombinase/integrase [Candidatus Dormibacteraceae bacterium]